MASFPPAVLAVLPPAVQQRSIGTLALNDLVNTFYSYEVPPGAGYVQAEDKVMQGGEMAVVRIDKKSTIIPVHLIWKDDAGRTWFDFLAQLDAQQGVPFRLGDGTQYDQCWAPSSEVQVARSVVLGTSPVRRAYELSINVRSRYSYRSPS